MQRLFRRGRVWYGWFYENGRRVTRTTRCRDRAAAERIAASGSAMPPIPITQPRAPRR